jgi:hypothetical protein
VINEVSPAGRGMKRFATIPALKPAEGMLTNAVPTEIK